MLDMAQRARQMIGEAVAGATTPVLLLSGGKDSLVLLRFCEPYRDRIKVVWSRTSAAFPHMIEFVRAATKGWDFTELISDQGKYFAQFGLPSAMIPMSAIAPTSKKRIIQARPERCCGTLQLQPLRKFIEQIGADVVIHGQKSQDTGKGIRPMKRLLGSSVPLVAPLDDWRNDEVIGYCLAYGVPLPHQYTSGLADSLECWNCPIKTDQKRYAWMRQHTPTLAVEIGVTLSAISALLVDAYSAEIAPASQDAERFLKEIAAAAQAHD